MVAVVAVASCAGLAVVQRRRRVDARLAAEREAERLRQAESRAAVQAQLEQSHRLESIGRLAGGVAHDFNNLLTVILSVAEETRDEARRGRAPAPGALDEMVAAAHRAADLTRQLLAFARRQIVAPVVLDVNEQLRNSEKLLRRVIGEDVRVVLDLQPDPWPVRCDPGLLGQVVLNLAVNARDAMPDGGTLTVTTRNLTVAPGDAVPDAEVVPGDYVRLAVEDTGTGMTPEVLAHIFEPFYTTKETGKGTGLGLATVYGIVKQSGAFMDVRSTPGEGSAFAILFPRQAAEAARAAAGEKGGTGGVEAILVVEDDPAVRKAMVQALRAGGYRVRTATGAREAVEVATAEPGGIHLLLTDVIMPGDGGREVARRVLAACPDVRVLYVSGYTDDAISRKGVLEEGSEFLSKPFTSEILRARVREILDRVPATPPGSPGSRRAENVQ
jgi:signal transduction histidine kinase/ActR/RegA family two-component response regulator